MDIIPANTAVNEIACKQSFEVYPNPASDVLYVNSLPCKMVDYAIFNVLGQKVIAGSTNGTISVADLEKGIYLLQIKGEKLLETAKFIVK